MTNGIEDKSPDVEAQVLLGVPVLVVEDDTASARLLLVLLRIHGAIVRVVRTAEEALETLITFPARVIVADLVLPRMSGLLLVEQLKAHPVTRDIPIVAVSIVNGLATERLALAAGCAAFVRKPIDVDTFIGIVLKAMGDSHE